MTTLRISILAVALLALGAAGIGGMMSARAAPPSAAGEETNAGCAIEAETIATEAEGTVSTVVVRCDGGSCVVRRDAADVVTSECSGDLACTMSEETAPADDGGAIDVLVIRCGDSTVTLRRCGSGVDQRVVTSGGDQSIVQIASSASTSVSTSTSVTTSSSTTIVQQTTSQRCERIAGQGTTWIRPDRGEVMQARRERRMRDVQERRNSGRTRPGR